MACTTEIQACFEGSMLPDPAPLTPRAAREGGGGEEGAGSGEDGARRRRDGEGQAVTTARAETKPNTRNALAISTAARCP